MLAAIFTVVMLASIGLPGLNGLRQRVPGADRHLRSPTPGGPPSPPSASSSSAIYLLWAYQRVFHGKAEGANATISDLIDAPSAGCIAPLLILLIVVLGVFPKPVLDRIEPSVNRILDEVTVANCPQHLL